MTVLSVLPYILVMAGVTYFIRMVPLAFVKKKVQNKFLLSFLYYIPYTVLAAMTFPAILSATGNIWSAAAALVVAVFLAFLEKGLLTVALASCGAAFIVEIFLRLAA